jgi:hypothetical protein
MLCCVSVSLFCRCHSRVVVHHLAVGLVEAGSQVSLSSSQTHGIADTLTQGAWTEEAAAAVTATAA